jgi:hypothetical protein
MKEFIFLAPILVTIALVLGGSRAEKLGGILNEARKSFVRLVVGIFLLCVVLQGILYVVPLLQ